MALSELPLSYCTNVHPGRSVGEVLAGLDGYTVKMMQRVGRPVAAGLWLARPVVAEIMGAADGVRRFADDVKQRGLVCYTLNAFPYGDFHSARVKENVYLPDWSQPERLAYTKDCATILAELLPEGVEGSISTVPLGFKGFKQGEGFVEACIAQFIELARHLDGIRKESGKVIRLAIEPEPMCILETTEEAIQFFKMLVQSGGRAGMNDPVRNHLGLCYDVCHQAVEFEDVSQSIKALAGAGVRINKVHISCAIELTRPGENVEGREALARYIEPRYLHQTIARTIQGANLRHLDLDMELVTNPPAAFAETPAWRVHFHVPVDAESFGPLNTTRGDLVRALGEVARLDYAPHLEVETYTWEVLPGREQVDLVSGLAKEMEATEALLAGLGRG